MANHHAAADQAILGIGNNAVREKRMQNLVAADFDLVTVIDPRPFCHRARYWVLGSIVKVAPWCTTMLPRGFWSPVRERQYGQRCGAVRCGAWMQVGAALGYGVKAPSGVTLALGEAQCIARLTNLRMTNESNSNFGTRDSCGISYHG